MVSALGGPPDFIENMDRYLGAAPLVRDIRSRESGIVSAIDTRGVGMGVVALGGGRTRPTDAIDHAVGFDRIVGIGARVAPGDVLGRVHFRTEADFAEAERRFRDAYTIGGTAGEHPLVAARILPPEV